MAEIQPPTFVAKGCYTSQQMRMLWASIICGEGVYASAQFGGTGPSSLAIVSDPAVPMGTLGRSGRAFVRGDSVQDQGMYFVWNSSDTPNLHSDSDPTDDRIDLVVAKVHDTSYEGNNTDPSTWEVMVIEGSPSPAPAPEPIPPSAIPLAEVRVRAGATSISAADITDLRESYTVCIGHGDGQAIELAGGVDLNGIMLPGVYTQSSNADAASGSNYPPANAGFGGTPMAGLLEVFRTPDHTKTWQRYTEYDNQTFIVWVRTFEANAWGDWYAIGGPGEWTLSPVTASASVGSLGPIPGSASRGVNRRGAIAIQFTWTAATLTADSNANFGDQILFTITEPQYRPPRDTDVLVVQSGVATFFGRINASGGVNLTHASYPGQQFTQGTVYRINAEWSSTE